MAVAIPPSNRFTRHNPCPICHGYPTMPSGKGMRCWGYTSGDGWIHCTREEYAGDLPRLSDGTYAHKPHSEAIITPFPKPIKPAKPAKPAKVYRTIPDVIDGYRKTDETPYLNDDGTLRYLTARYEKPRSDGHKPDKQFFPFRPVAGGYVMNMDCVEHTLFGQIASTTYVVEGEKCAKRLQALGLAAVCNDGGAGKWNRIPDVGKRFAGVHVIALADHDAPGQRHAEQVAQSVKPYAASVRVITLPGLPDSGDVADWLDAGHTIDALEQIAAFAPEWTSAPEEPQTACDPTLASALLDAYAIIARQAHAILALQEEKRRTKAILAHPDLKQAQKDALLCLPEKAWTGQEVKIFMPVEAAKVGKKEHTIRNGLDALHASGVLVKRNIHEDGGHERVTIQLTPETISAPATITVLDEMRASHGKHAKPRRTCTECGSENLVERTICKGCGAILSERDVNAQDEAHDNDCHEKESTHSVNVFPEHDNDCHEIHKPRPRLSLEDHIRQIEQRGITGEAAIRLALIERGALEGTA